MKLLFEATVKLTELPANRIGYAAVVLERETVNKFPKQRATRLVCALPGIPHYQCGLNHFGEGNYFILIRKARFNKLGKSLGDEIAIKLYEDPNPLGVAIPEVLEVLLAQDDAAKAIYDKLTDGRKRTLIHTMGTTKNIDVQVQRALQFLEEESVRQKRMQAKQHAKE